MYGFHRRTSLAGAEDKGLAVSTHQKAQASPCRPPAWPQPWVRDMNLGRDREGDGEETTLEHKHRTLHQFY